MAIGKFKVLHTIVCQKMNGEKLLFCCFIAFLALVGNGVNANEYVEGRHYKTLSADIEGYQDKVVEFYNFACVYCFRAEGGVAYLEQHLPENIQLTRLPLVLGKGERFNSAAYVGWIADELGYMEKYRHYLFQLARAPLPWEIKRYNRLSSMENVRTLFMDMGTDAKIYEAAVKSAKARIEITEALARQLKITSTPAFLVRGKYLVQGMRSKPFAEFMMADLILHLAIKP